MRSLPVSVLTLLLIYITSAEGALNAPLNLSVVLLDFRASIYWLPGPWNPIGTRYSVEFIEVQNFSKTVWKKPAGCSNITERQCHLFPDQFFENYFVRVMAEWKDERSNWTILEHTFQPYKDTQLSSPEMKISPTHHSIHIRLSHKIQAVYQDVPLRFNVDLFRMTSSKTVEHIGKSKNTGVFNFSNLPSGYSYCINASAFHTEMSIIQNLNATGCIFLQQGPRGVIVGVGVLLLLVISAGIILSAKGLLRTLIKDGYFPKVLLIKGGTAAPQTLNVETPCVHPLSVSDYPQVIESTHDDLDKNASKNYMQRGDYRGIDDELDNAYGPLEGYSGIDDELEGAYGPVEGHPNLYSSAALMEESEEPLAQEEHPNFGFFAQGSPHVSTETLYWLEDYDDEDNDYSVIYYVESMESSEEDTDTEQADEDTLESSYEPRAHLWSEGS
uniref:Uncharacterized LOC103029795 n=1 Tax=Astyanax mexicanus TaxID=7994 RepID=W5KIY2_ASTMX